MRLINYGGKNPHHQTMIVLGFLLRLFS